MQNDRRSFTLLLLLLAFLLGTLVRVLPVAQAGFPLNDGGMFYSMASDLDSADFSLPLITSYNHLGIPYAYPPLPFYLIVLLSRVTHASLFEILRWLGVAFSLFSLPAFYLLARAFLEDNLKASLATLIFALLPRAFEWVIMGGGATRSPAGLFLILMCWAAYRMFRQGSWKFTLLTTLFGALIVLTHPERALHAAAAAILFWGYFGRSRRGVMNAVLAGLGVLLLSSPWWITILSRFGWQPFSLAIQSSGQRWLFWSPLLLLDFTDETISLAALLAVVGTIACLVQKRTLLPAWLGLAFLVDPRSAPHVVAVQTSLLAALGLTEVLFPAIARLAKPDLERVDHASFLASRTGKWVFAYLLVMLLVNALLNLQSLNQLVLSRQDRRALAWVAKSTPAAARFIALDWQENAMLSPLLEWFPALGERTNLSTLQGREWLPGGQNFSSRLKAAPALAACLYQEQECLQEWANQQQEAFDYVYLSLVPAGSQEARTSVLAESLKRSDLFQVVYQDGGVLIFSRR